MIINNSHAFFSHPLSNNNIKKYCHNDCNLNRISQTEEKRERERERERKKTNKLISFIFIIHTVCICENKTS